MLPRTAAPARQPPPALTLAARGSAARRRRAAGRAAAGAPPPPAAASPHAALNAGIAAFYDASTGLWEQMWGEHLHHGYYPKGGPRVSHAQAQVDMVDAVIAWAGVESVAAAVDVGCGLGGSARHLARRFGARVDGVTLSGVQAARGAALSAAAGLAGRVRLRVADALAMPFADGAFDLVWSLESGEHMPDKPAFVGELARVAAPGGRVVLVTWCTRDLAPGEALRGDEQRLLGRICDAYHLPAWCSRADYAALFEAAGLVDTRVADWSDEVAPFWGAVIRSALSARGLAGLARAGWATVKGALVMPLMARGLATGTIRFALLTARKPPV